jgi:lipid II isoglutaminyl synthase (glutamine-hydrolysing)
VKPLRIAHLYPEHLNIYADRGNISVLTRRCGWRGLDIEVTECGPGDTLPTFTTWEAARTATRC